MATLLQIAMAGNPILRKKAEEVTNVNSPEMQSLIENMLATCQEMDGVGIAAPQVYVPWRVIVVASKPNARYPHAPHMEPLVMINPILDVRSTAVEDGWEGCLSVPGLRALVPRHKKIAVSFTNRNGKYDARVYEGFVARIVQHEIDHLNGTLFFDHADRRSFISEFEFQRRVREGRLEEPV